MAQTSSPPADAQALADATTCVVFRAGNAAEAFAVADRLSRANVQHSIQEQWSAAYDGVWGLSGGDWGHVVVFERDRARAAEVVAEFLRTRADKPV